ncbi:MAG: mechanosensitive ion channel [Candidatus Omnitrophica bacterium]|nr:mechanosensitive ion channel [Candidatus Omnitrophota bacterium]
MENILFTKVIVSVIVFLFVFAVSFWAKVETKKIQREKKLARNRYYTIKRLINLFSLVILVALFVIIWGIKIKNLWVNLTGILAMIAVAFFAVWSLIGNILAGIIIFFTSPFKANDEIEILPDNVKGKVLAINTFFTLISDAEENIISIPNSILFQKYIKKIKKRTA